jgi:hypothetical protein
VQIIDNVSTFALDSRANSILFVRGNNLRTPNKTM